MHLATNMQGPGCVLHAPFGRTGAGLRLRAVCAQAPAESDVQISDSDASTESDDGFLNPPKPRGRPPLARHKAPAARKPAPALPAGPVSKGQNAGGKKATSALPASPVSQGPSRPRGEARRLSVGEAQVPASPLTESEAERGVAAMGEAKRSRSPMSEDGSPGKRVRRMSARVRKHE
jgi:hypothetical protein